MKEWVIIQDARDEGIDEGRRDINDLNIKLISLGRIDDLERSAKDPKYQQQLIYELFPEKAEKTL